MEINNEITNNISLDVMASCRSWIKAKHKWFRTTIEDSKLSDDHILQSVSVIRHEKTVIIGFMYLSGRSSSKFYVMLNKKFHEFCETVIKKVIEDKYDVEVEFSRLGNHNPNPETETDLNLNNVSKAITNWNN